MTTAFHVERLEAMEAPISLSELFYAIGYAVGTVVRNIFGL